MSQTSVENEPVQAYEGKVQHGGQFPTTTISRLATELTFFGKAVSPILADVDMGGAGDLAQQCQLPTSLAEINAMLGVAIADPSVERLRDPAALGVPNSAPFGAYSDEAAVPIMRKGRIWVVVDTKLASLDDGVFIRFQNAGGTPPTESLGSFDTVNSADHEPAPAGFSWVGASTQGATEFALLEINLP